MLTTHTFIVCLLIGICTLCVYAFILTRQYAAHGTAICRLQIIFLFILALATVLSMRYVAHGISPDVPADPACNNDNITCPSALTFMTNAGLWLLTGGFLYAANIGMLRFVRHTYGPLKGSRRALHTAIVCGLILLPAFWIAGVSAW